MRPVRTPATSGGRAVAALAGVAAVAAVAVLGLAACTEDALTGVDPDTAPGDAAETIEIELSAAALPMWRDTSYLGYALPSTSGACSHDGAGCGHAS